MSRFLAAIYDRATAGAEAACLAAWRHDLLAPLEGRVLEIGAGTGANLAHYGAGVTELVLAEPDDAMRSKLARRVEGSTHRIELIGAPAERLPVTRESFDVVVSTLVLCSVTEPASSLAEAWRVLRPGGVFVFLEHVASEEPSRLAWQRRFEPLWKRIAGNCHLTRRTGEAIERAGFALEAVTAESMRKSIPIVRPTVRGVARKPR